MKRAILVHGWTGAPDRDWFPWLRTELERKGFAVAVPALPDTDHPHLGAWLAALSAAIGTPNEQCYLVGHSMGCPTILRYLEQAPECIGGAVLVAGLSEEFGYSEVHSFFAKPFDWQAIRARCARFIAIHSDDDPDVPPTCSTAFQQQLGAELILLHGFKHFSGGDGVFELPEARDAVLALATPR